MSFKEIVDGQMEDYHGWRVIAIAPLQPLAKVKMPHAWQMLQT